MGKVMKKNLKKIIAAFLAATIFCSVTTVDAYALTRRLYGDVNNDGIISNADITLVQQYIARLVTFDTYQKIAADVNGDGKVSMVDVTLMQEVLAGKIDGFPVGDYFMY